MATQHYVLKGFIKTENAILLMVLGLAMGFVAGIVFSAFRSNGQLSDVGNTHTPAAVQLNAQQTATQAALIQQTQDNPQNAEAWVHLGHFYFDAGQPEKAIEAYLASLDLDDTRPDIWTDLGVMYRRTSKPQKAVKSFDRALGLNPSHEIAMFNKGIVLMHDIQDPQGALQAWQKLVETNPEARTPNGILVKEMIEEILTTN